MAARRYQGRLRKWNTERSYGFILANDSGQDVYVHISAFPRDGRAPQEGDELSFEVEPDGQDRKHAVRVEHVVAMPPAKPLASRPRPDARPLGRAPYSSSWGSNVIGLVVLVALGWYGYSQHDKQVVQMRAAQAAPIHASQVLSAQSSTVTCDGRKTCSQMTSCAEAKLFLKNCPDVEMDGNHDGVPCQQQWCN